MKQFICFFKPPRENFNENQTDEENKIISDHFLYLKKLLNENILILAGPEANAKFGVSVFEAESEEEAWKIVNNDPAVINKVFTAEIYPFRVSLLKK